MSVADGVFVVSVVAAFVLGALAGEPLGVWRYRRRLRRELGQRPEFVPPSQAALRELAQAMRGDDGDASAG